MPRYYFHLRDADGVEIDDEGIAFTDLELAVKDATRAARDMIIEAARAGHDLSSSSFQITDDAGPAATLAFSEVVTRDPATVRVEDRREPAFHNRR